MLTPPQTLRLTEKSTIRYRLKQNQDKPLQLMLLTSKAEGGFGGNFQAMIERDQLKPGPDGWCDVQVPVSAFKSVTPRHTSLVGNVITSALLTSLQADTKLSVILFELKSSN